jgi:hypothetical protein
MAQGLGGQEKRPMNGCLHRALGGSCLARRADQQNWDSKSFGRILGLCSDAKGLTMLLLPQLLKLSDVRFAPFAMRRCQLPSDILLEFALGRAALDLLQAQMMLGVDLAERA